jgi:glycosyltransferase involved in cell wall biosynthesis
MKIGLVSYHFQNTTAEGIATARVAAALSAAGHGVVVFTSAAPSAGRDGGTTVTTEAGTTVHRIASDPALTPAWWRWTAEHARRSRVLDKIVALPNLVHGCSVGEWAWVQAASHRVIQVNQTEGAFDVLHSRLNPHLSHLAALAVVRAVPSSPWCAYFSDPWPHSLYPDPYVFTIGPIARVRLEALLNTMVSRADSLIVPAERLKTALFDGARRNARDRTFVAPHLSRPGVEAAPPTSHEALIIRHSGFLMKERRIDPLYDSLRLLIRRRPEIAGRLRLEFAGWYGDNALPEPPSELKNVVGFSPYMDTSAVWDWVQGADVLLLVEAKMREGIFFPSKLSEYLGAGRPILALSPGAGVAADILAGSGTLRVEPDEPAAIADAVSRLWDDWRDGRLQMRTPSERCRKQVSADAVVPLYIQAFAAAIERRGALCR